VHANRVLHFNNILDAIVAGGFLGLVTAIVLLSTREWILLVARRKLAVLHETAPVWLPDYAIAESKPLQAASLVAVLFALAKELSGEAEVERARVASNRCACELSQPHRASTFFNSERRNPKREADSGCESTGLQTQCATTAWGRPNPVKRAESRLYVAVAERKFKGIKQCC